MKQLAWNITFFLAALAGYGQAPSDDHVTPSTVLTKASNAFRTLGSFHNTLNINVTVPGKEPTTRTIYFGAGSQGLLIDAGFRYIVASQGHLTVTQEDISDKYVPAPYNNDLRSAFHLSPYFSPHIP